ncbi:MAG: SRPBCC domain-containing protein [Pseudomonadota bacterium]
MTDIPAPDLSHRPRRMTCQRHIEASPTALFEAWTTRFDLWFAEPGTLALVPEPGRPYFFYNRQDWGRHPHYGRILSAAPAEHVEMTWLTGNGEAVGTEGAETVLRIDLVPDGALTEVQLSHAGFVSDASLAGHEENWPLALDILADCLRA